MGWSATAAPGAPAASGGGADAWRPGLLALAGEVVRTAVAPADWDRPLGELGFDSIRLTALSAALARATGVAVDEAVFYELRTLAGVARHLVAHGAVPGGTEPAELAASGVAVEPRGAPPASVPGAAEPIAIIGLELRLPGADGPAAFWANLRAGFDAVGPWPEARRRLAGGREAGEGGYLAGIDAFDAPAFGLSRREAAAMDPRQRLFLEAAWRAIEHAAVPVSRLAGSRTGVFVGIVGGSEYDPGDPDPAAGVDAGAQRALGAASSLIAARVSYLLDLRGPSAVIDTACSGSLVALHRAVTALRLGECDLALAGGVNLILDPGVTEEAAKTGMISPRGRCRAFDASADGYVRGEGVVALLLKPLGRAQADGDPILALVRGTAENHGGRAAGLTAPNPAAQVAVIREAHARAGVEPGSIALLETHGTGTQLGDPIEVNALREVWAGAADPLPCALGAVKTQLGHLEAAAGLAGVAKAVLALRAGLIPGNLHLAAPNPRVRLEGTPFHLPAVTTAWPGVRRPGEAAPVRRAGVSSFGVSGITAHAELEAAPAPPAAPVGAGPALIALSARTAAALTATAAELAAYLASEMGARITLADLATTLLAGREPLAERLAFAAADVAEARSLLAAGGRGETPAAVRRGAVAGEGAGPDLRVAWARGGAAAAEAWVAGAAVPTGPLPWGGRRVSLPGRAFERRSYWSARAQPPPAVGPDLGRLRAEHRVAGAPVFPAVGHLGLVRTAADAAADAFRPCRWERITWLRPLTAEPAAAAVVLGDGAEGRAFVVRSAAGEHARGWFAWGNAAVPRAPGPAPAAGDPGVEQCAAAAIYARLGAAGLSYGPLYRTLDEAVIGPAAASATLSAPAGAPGLWPAAAADGVLQLAALLRLRRGDERGVPFAADRLAWHAPWPDRLQVHVWRNAEGAIDGVATDAAGRPVLSLEGYAVRPWPAAALAVPGNEAPPAATGAEPRLDAARAAEEVAALEAMTATVGVALRERLRARGVWAREGEVVDGPRLAAALGATPEYARLCASLPYHLAAAGLAEAVPGGWRLTSGLGAGDGAGDLTTFAAAHPRFAPHARLLAACLDALPEVVSGRRPGAEVLFPGGSVQAVAALYEGSVMMDHANAVAAAAVLAALPPAGGPAPRVLEVGAGTGATTEAVAARLARERPDAEYFFTDIAPAFRRHGQERFGPRYPAMRFGLLDLERPPGPQGYSDASCDVIVAANVLHTLAELGPALRHLRGLLRPGGRLVLVEATRAHVLNGLTYGLLARWWACRDPERRRPEAPLSDEAQWRRILAEEGYRDVAVLGRDPAPADRFPQAVLVARRDPADVVAAAPVSAAGAIAGAPTRAAPAAGAAEGEEAADEALTRWLRARTIEVVARAVQAEGDPVGEDATFESLGVDSILAVEIIERLNRDLGLTLRTPDLFNHPSVRRLVRRILATAEPDVVQRLRAAALPPSATVSAPVASMPVAAAAAPTTEGGAGGVGPAGGPEPIAIIGMAGQFPDADDLDEFWANLAAGRDSVREVPADRWDWRARFSPDRREPLRSYSRWGGFLRDPAAFDPLFFRCTPREADLMDPHQRLFLMAAWRALEDAGYSDRALDDARCGVFAGCCAGDYETQLVGRPDWGEAGAFLGNASAILAGRVPFLLNLKGPALAVDTACSSSLVAIHLACESLRAGGCTLALAGGVAVMSSDGFHIRASKTGLLSPTGRCRSFGAGADGIVPAEGVGVVVLKPLGAALRDGDPIHAVIRASGVNQNGRTNGITAPSAPAQAELETAVYRGAGVDPASLDYVECHGTGTGLGDPMEVAALTEAFRGSPARVGGCALGSVKSNFGHALAAAGVAGLLKVVLALRHGVIPPTLHARPRNPELVLEGGPFRIADEAEPWPARPGAPRRAAVSSFGFSGANAHLVLEAPPGAAPPATPARPGPHLFLVSGFTATALARRVADLAAWLATPAGAAAALADVSFTLAVGRSHFGYRFAVVAADAAELRAALQAFAGGVDEGVRHDLPAARERRFREGLRAAVGAAERSALLAEAREAYLAGADAPWDFLFPAGGARRVRLPVYPFDLRRCWFAPAPGPAAAVPSAAAGGAQAVAFTADDPVLADHRVQGEPLLPGAAVAGLVLAAAGARPGHVPVLRALTWLRPVDGAAAAALTVRWRPGSAEGDWELISGEASAEVRHAQGGLAWEPAAAAATVDLAWPAEAGARTFDGAAWQELMARGGVAYGPAFQVVRRVVASASRVVARLALEPSAAGGAAREPVPAPLLDGAFQVAALLGPAGDGGFRFPYGLGRLEVLAPWPDVVCVEASGDPATGAALVVAGEDGRVVARLSGYVTRPPRPGPAPVWLVPGWVEAPRPPLTPVAAEDSVWIVRDGASPVAAALAERHPDAVVLELGGGRAGVDPADAGAWAREVAARPAPRRIYFLAGEPDPAADELVRVRVAQARGVRALFRLVKALQAHDRWTPGLVLRVVTRGLWAVDGAPGRPHVAAVAGLAASLGREYPDVDCAAVDLPAAEPEAGGAAVLAAAVAAEPAQRAGERVAWRGGRRFTFTLTREEAA
ncbi:MAG: beta-ketoacyl synthase N-terminal-like domain-containing protein [Opitutaceae bacterium]